MINNNVYNTIARSFFIFILLFAGAWFTVDLSESVVDRGINTANAIISCHTCIKHDGGGGGGGGWGGGGGTIGGGGGDGGGGGGGHITPVCTLTANPSSLSFGDSTNLSWTTTRASTATINQNIGAVNISNGTRSVTPPVGSTTYTMTVTSATGRTATCSDTVTVAPQIQPPVCTMSIAPSTIELGEDADITWETRNATSFSINRGVGALSLWTSPIANGTKSITPGSAGTFVYTGTVQNSAGDTATCTAAITVETPPPAPGCIRILKETFDTTGAPLTPVAQFTFKLGSRTVTSDANGHARFDNVTPGLHTVTEVDAGSSWDLISVTPSGGVVNVPSGSSCAAVVFKNKQVVTNPPVCTIDAPAIAMGETTTELSWTISNAAAAFLNGAGITPQDGSKTVGAGTYNLKVRNSAGAERTCSITIDPPPIPPAPGCIRILKETFDTTGAPLTPVAQFTFKLGSRTVTSDANGHARFDNVTPGLHTVTEVDAGSSWDLISVTPSGGVVNVPSGSSCAAVVFKNKQVVTNPPVCTIDAPAIAMGETTTELSWTISNAAAAFLNGAGITPQDGSKTVGAGTYNLKVRNSAGAERTCSITIDPPPTPNAPVCTLTSNPSVVDLNATSTLQWSTQNAVSFEINQGIGSVSIGSGSKDTVPLTSTRTFTGVAKNSAGDTTSCSTTVTVNQPPDPVPACTLTASDSQIDTGDSITLTWTSANVTSGSIDNNVGSISPVGGGTTNTLFPSTDTNYTATFSGPHGDVTCSAEVRVNTGCTNCGGGLNQPNVSLASAPGGEVLGASFVSLAQVPYTGFEAGPFLTMLFWLAVALWSLGITYVLIGRGSLRFFAERIGIVPQTSNARDYHDYEPPSYDNTTAAPQFNEADEFERDVEPVAAATMAPSVAPAPQRHAAPASRPSVVYTPNAAGALPELSDVIESRAHAAGILLSPEAVMVATHLRTERAETLKAFGDVLNEAVRTIPREDGWIHLSGTRVRELIRATESTNTPQEESVVEESPEAPAHTSHAQSDAKAPALEGEAVNRFVAALLSGNRDEAFTLLAKIESEGVSATRFATAIATTLDRLCRSRKTGTEFNDLDIKEKAATVSDAALSELVEVFAHALDTSYTSQFTNLKIALAQAFDVRVS
ncbi:MAG: collagen binding domain-containing protein [Patescibacteria group bacterium UBA2163]